MIQPQNLIKGLKKKFFFLSSVGVISIALISFYTLNLHMTTVKRQSLLQTTYLKISEQLRLVQKASLLGEMFNDEVERKNLEIEKEFKNLLKELRHKKKVFNKWLENSDANQLEEIKTLLANKGYANKMSHFLTDGQKLVDSKKDSKGSLILDDNIKALSKTSIEGIGRALYSVIGHLQKEQKNSLSKLNQMGLFLILLGVAQAVVVWLLIFRPLYLTVIEQHERLTEAILKAESASRSKTEFLANISHEIRTPMTAILGYADLLERDDIKDIEKKDAVSVIDKNAHHLMGLIDEILDISKIESGRFDFDPQTVDLTQTLNEVYSLINVKAYEKGVELIFESEGEFPEKIWTDSKRLKQILFNLIGNAIKFTDEGFVRLIVSYRREKNLIYFQIDDTGTGIDPKKRSRLFKPFEQADSSVARKNGGTGLGLVLSKGLARGLGGDVRILRSELGKGTTVEAFIEAGNLKNTQMAKSFSTNVNESSPTSIDQSLQGVKILVVDDAKENSRLFDLYLSKAGAKVRVANDGDTAIAMAKKCDFNVVLLDLQMPKKDGFQVIKEMRKIPFERPIAALTAHAMKEEKFKTKAAGFDAHITKPVSPEELVRNVYELNQV